VIDYALAKGLAHEAFGHASEADGFRSSILAVGGKFRRGESVGASHVSIIDEPRAGDHAWQPYLGIRRENASARRSSTTGSHRRAHDPWSQIGTGSRLTNADRAESFRAAPAPAHVEHQDRGGRPASRPRTFEDYGPDDVRDLLAAAGVLKRHPRRLSLRVQRRAGQPRHRRFRLQLQGHLRLSASGITPAQTGDLLGIDVRGASLDPRGVRASGSRAIGTCGKWGQNVPSSGGSHYFVALDPDDAVRLGGR
jgi:TldD protein